jgi:hypothetical protein
MREDEIIETAIQGHASTRDAVRWAIQQEREACAKVCEEWLHGDWHNQGVVAAAMIRARGEK